MITPFIKVRPGKIPVQIIFCLLLILLLANTAAAVSAPKLELRKKPKAKVAVKVLLSRKQLKKASRIEVERIAPRETDFRVIKRITELKKRNLFADEPIYDGSYRYRARIVGSDGTSRWSKALKIRVQPSHVVPPKTPLAEGQEKCPSGYVRQVFKLVNKYRKENGAEPLKLHMQLNWAARTHTIIIAESGNFSHDGWSGYIRDSGYRGGRIGENIAWGYSSPDWVMSGWMNSSGHRANILSSGYRYIGIGCIIDGGYYWTQNFGG